MRLFTRFACADWSGAKGSRHPGIALAVCDVGDEAPRLVTPPNKVWSRQAVADWLVAQDDDLLIGFDFSFAPPLIERGSYLPGDDVPSSAKDFWAYVDHVCDDPDLGAASFLEYHHRRHFYLGAAAGAKPPAGNTSARCGTGSTIAGTSLARTAGQPKYATPASSGNRAPAHARAFWRGRDGSGERITVADTGSGMSSGCAAVKSRSSWSGFSPTSPATARTMARRSKRRRGWRLETVTSRNLGKARRVEDAAGRYIEFCKGTVRSSISLAGLKIVVDCANGATYQWYYDERHARIKEVRRDIARIKTLQNERSRSASGSAAK